LTDSKKPALAGKPDWTQIPRMSKTTHFGFEDVDEDQKSARVGGVFSSVAPRYDLMNDLMSAGLHRLWKRFAVELCGVRNGAKVLDVAGGTADLAILLARRAGDRGQVWLTDINADMLGRGRTRSVDAGLVLPVTLCDAERLPFAADYFDCITVAFGLRNMTHKDAALAEMLRVLRPGGRLIVLEFSRVWRPLSPLFDAYAFNVLPVLGKLVVKDADSYRYLAESIRMHPSQQELADLMRQAGFERVEYFNLSAGVVAVHRGFKN
jgi:demethylmenaquinone methyltransferase/2-methoxy-6-polyprenyl-1,4-benzoquinol methylase